MFLDLGVPDGLRVEELFYGKVKTAVSIQYKGSQASSYCSYVLPPFWRGSSPCYLPTYSVVSPVAGYAHSDVVIDVVVVTCEVGPFVPTGLLRSAVFALGRLPSSFLNSQVKGGVTRVFAFP